MLTIFLPQHLQCIAMHGHVGLTESVWEGLDRGGEGTIVPNFAGIPF